MIDGYECMRSDIRLTFGCPLHMVEALTFDMYFGVG